MCMAGASTLTRAVEIYRDKVINYTLAYQGPPMCKVMYYNSAQNVVLSFLEDLKLLKNVRKTQSAHEIKTKITQGSDAILDKREKPWSGSLLKT